MAEKAEESTLSFLAIYYVENDRVICKNRI